MSKMSQFHAELSEQAYDMGYQSLGEAEQMGCEIDWENAILLPPEEFAHESLMKEKEEILKIIDFVIARAPECRGKLMRVQKFIEQEVK